MSVPAERLRERAESMPLTVIAPWRPGVWARLSELWRYRALVPWVW
jgi:hypothetical protein